MCVGYLDYMLFFCLLGNLIEFGFYFFVESV